MEQTPQSAKVLTGALLAHDWDQNDLARESGISRAVVSFHLTGSRPIRDDHLASYCNALDRDERPILVAAWLRDTLSESVQADVLDPRSSKLNEEARTWSANLTNEQKEILEWWATQMPIDSELADLLHMLTRRAGWVPRPKEDTPPPGASVYAAMQRTADKIRGASGGEHRKNAG